MWLYYTWCWSSSHLGELWFISYFIRAATVQIQILSGKYFTDYSVSKWTNESGACLLNNCGFYPGDIEHLLSTSCPAVGPALTRKLVNSLLLLEDRPDLHEIITSAYNDGPNVWCSLLVDPTTFPPLIAYRQQFGLSSILPVLKFARHFIWCMHKTRMQLRNSTDGQSF